MTDLGLGAAWPARPLGLSLTAVRWTVGAIVAVSFGVRTLLASAHVTPYYLPDEYVYPALARGIADSGRPLIREAEAGFPALLDPLLTAPLWLIGDVEDSYRLVQTFHALAMSLAAVPVFLLAQRLGLGLRWALGAAALAVASPDLVYASSTLADAVAYPLALAATYAAVRAIDEPTRRAQLAFLGIAGLATLARIQYVILPLVLLLAATVAARGRVRLVTHRFRPTLVAVVAAVVAVLALGPARVLGAYAGVAGELGDVASIASWFGLSGFLLTGATGIALVPGAVLGLALGLRRPLEPVEAAFAAFVAVLGGALLLEAAVVSSFDSRRFHERYLVVLIPLALPAFALCLRRRCDRRHTLAVAAIAAGVATAAMLLPLSAYTGGNGEDDSPTLRALAEFERLAGVANASLAAALLLTALAVFGAWAAVGGKRRAIAAYAAALMLSIVLSAGAVINDSRASRVVRETALAADPSWVDDAELGRVTLVQTPRSAPEPSLLELFWNRSVVRLVRLEGAAAVDAFSAPEARVARDGRLVAGGETVRGPLLLARYGSFVQLAGARLVATGPAFELWRPTAAAARISLLAEGLSHDGWFAPDSSITVWPNPNGRTQGTFRLTLVGPPGAQSTQIELTGSTVRRTVRLRPDAPRTIILEIAHAGPWHLKVDCERPVILGAFRRVCAAAPEAPVFASSVRR